MKRKLSPILLSIVGAFQLAAATTASAADGAPSFIEVGKRYTLTIPIGSQLTENQFKVLEIGSGGWIKVAMLQGNQIMWLNTQQALLIAPYPAQVAE